MGLEYADLVEPRLDSDAVLLAAEACRRYIMRHAKPKGVRATDLVNCVRDMRALSAHGRQRVQVLLIKMPTLSCMTGCAKRGTHDALRFWPEQAAPIGAFNITRRARCR